MSLPPGWAEATVDDLGEFLNGMAFKPTDWGSEGLGIVRIQNLTDPQKPLNKTLRAFKECYRVSRGDILVSWSATLDAFIWDRDDAILNQHIFKVTPGECVEPRFLYHLLRELILEMIESGHLHGSTMKHINRGPFLAHRAFVPPLAEQRRIVAKLDALTARLARARDETFRQLTLCDELRRSILVRSFGAEVRPDWVTLGDVGLQIEAGRNLQCQERPPQPGERGVVKVSAVSGGNFRPEESKTLPPAYEPPARDRILAGDLLLARASGSRALVGRVARVPEDTGNLFLSDKVLRLRLPTDHIDWAYWFLRSPAARSQIEGAASGISMHNITQGSLKAVKLPLPSGGKRATLLEVVKSTFARADRLEAEARKALALIDRLEAATLARAFRGELVPQDPNDEPASVLLERIRARRAAEPKAKRGRRPKLAS